MKKETIEKIFKANKEAEELFITTDDQPFINKRSAENHQNSLNRDAGKNDKLEVIKRSDMKNMKDEDPVATNDQVKELQKQFTAKETEAEGLQKEVEKLKSANEDLKKQLAVKQAETGKLNKESKK